MRKPQISLLTVSTAVASMLLASTAIAGHNGHANYKGNYKGEPCPVELVLKDGLYVGLQAGHDSYRVVDEISSEYDYWYDERVVNINLDPVEDNPAFGVKLDPTLNATGAVGGGFIGYGKYFGDFYNVYLGIEGFGNWSGAETSYNLTVAHNPLAAPVAPATAVEADNYYTKVNVDANYGVSVLPGIKLNNTTLLYVRLGYNWAQFNVKETVNADIDTTADTATLTNVPVTYSDCQTKGGFNYGVGVESTFYDNWSARIEYAHTDFDDITTDFGNKIKPQDNQFMFGVIYHVNM